MLEIMFSGNKEIRKKNLFVFVFDSVGLDRLTRKVDVIHSKSERTHK